MSNDPDLNSPRDTAAPRPAGYVGEPAPAATRAADRNSADAPRTESAPGDTRSVDGRVPEADAPRHADPVIPREQLDRQAADARHDVVARQKEKFGGFKFGAAFFGWLAAMGLAVLLTALVSAIGAGIGLGANEGDVDAAAQDAAASADTVTLVGAIALAVVLFISYYAGGYVAGRMARFSGAKQGLAVWIWAVIIAIVVAIVTALAGSQFDVLSTLNGFPRIPIDAGELTAAGIITLVLALLVPLVGAVLGGLAGMRYHRRIDKAGFGN